MRQQESLHENTGPLATHSRTRTPVGKATRDVGNIASLDETRAGFVLVRLKDDLDSFELDEADFEGRSGRTGTRGGIADYRADSTVD